MYMYSCTLSYPELGSIEKSIQFNVVYDTPDKLQCSVRRVRNRLRVAGAAINEFLDDSFVDEFAACDEGFSLNDFANPRWHRTRKPMAYQVSRCT